MKKWILAAVLLCVVQANAQQRGRNITDRLTALSDRINQKIQSDARYLDRQQLNDLMDHLQSMRAILNGNSGPSYPPSEDYSVRGRIENASFSFQVRSLEELYSQCSEFYASSRIGQYDDVNVSFNFGSEQRYHNSSSYWNGAFQACGRAAVFAKSQGLRTVSHRYEYVVTGAMEADSFMFVGNSLNDIASQCEDFHRSNRIGAVDDIFVSKNFERIQAYHNSSGYWRSDYETCQKVVQSVR